MSAAASPSPAGRETILAAAELFAAKGFAGVSVREVAERAGVSAEHPGQRGGLEAHHP